MPPKPIPTQEGQPGPRALRGRTRGTRFDPGRHQLVVVGLHP